MIDVGSERFMTNCRLVQLVKLLSSVQGVVDSSQVSGLLSW